MIKSKQNKLYPKLLELFQQKFGIEPPSYIESILHRSTLNIETQNLQLTDIPYIKLLLTMKLSGITIKCYNQAVDVELIPLVIKRVKHSQNNLVELVIINYNIKEYVKQLTIAFGLCKTLKSIKLISCSITNQTLQYIMHPLQTNINIHSIDLSNNKISLCSSIINVLNEYDRYYSQKIEMNRLDIQEIANHQNIELNLQSNQIEDIEAVSLAEYIKSNRWVRGINLSWNKITASGIQKIISILQPNKNILNLDLRNNPGWSIEISNLIFNKIRQNLLEYKIKKSKAIKKQTNSVDLGHKKPNQQNLTMNHQHFIEQNISCQNCKKLCCKIFQTEKKVIDLQLEISKLKKILQNRGFEISVINPSSTPQNTSQISFSNKNMGVDSSSDDIVQKIEMMMLELTKIFEANQVQHNTQVDITNAHWSNHNLSNTVQILINNQNSIIVPLPEEEDQLSDIQS